MSVYFNMFAFIFMYISQKWINSKEYVCTAHDYLYHESASACAVKLRLYSSF